MVGWKEALLALRLNGNGKATVECPAGTTDNIEIKENVRQGTIYGPKLCGIVADKINIICRKNLTLPLPLPLPLRSLLRPSFCQKRQLQRASFYIF